MRRLAGAALLLAVFACPAALAQTPSRDLPPSIGPDHSASLTVEDFLRGAQVLGEVGPERAEQNADYVAAIRGLANIGDNYRTDVLKARAAGTTIDSCPGKSAKVTTDTLIPFLLHLPPEQRTMPMEQAFRLHMRELYPCPAKGAAR